MTIVRKLQHKNKVYTITFDEDGILDTVVCDGKLLVSTNAVVKKIFNNADMILVGCVPEGFVKVR